MKTTAIISSILCLFVLLSGCVPSQNGPEPTNGGTENTPPPGSPDKQAAPNEDASGLPPERTLVPMIGMDDPDNTINPEGKDAIEFEAKYIRTIYRECDYPKCVVISSEDELKRFIAQDGGVSTMGEGESATPGYSSYDDAFFKDNMLLIATTSYTSGSISQEVVSVTLESDGYHVYIKPIPFEGMGTADMANWNVVIELARSYYRSDTAAFAHMVNKDSGLS